MWKLSSDSFSFLGEIRSKVTDREARGKRYSIFDAREGIIWLLE